MFERFTAGARSAVLDAETHARAFDAVEIRSEHLLLGVLRSDDSPVVRLIETHVTREDLRQLLTARLDRAA
jgi:ATP-dependent Clp protease ATP-binding subunit ClpA